MLKSSHIPESTTGLPVITTMKEMKENKRIKTNIEVGSVMKVKVGGLEETTREGRSRRTEKEVAGCGHDVVGKNNFLS